MMRPSMPMTIAEMTPMTISTVPSPKVLARLTESVPRIKEPRPKPIIRMPLDRPTLSGNHTLVVAMTQL